MTVMDYNGPGFTYHLKYRPFNASTWHQVVLGGAEDKFTVSNAGINQLWYFKIRANNSEGFGPICPENNSSSGQPSKYFIG